MKILPGLCMLILFLTACIQQENTPSIALQKPGMVIHRGANRLAPENTLAAIQKAIDLGAEYVEVDVRTSKDGVLYNFHDTYVNRTTNGDGPFAELNSKEINTLDAGSWFDQRFKEEKVPTIESILKLTKGKCKIYFDVKECDYNKLVDLVKKHGMENVCFFWFGNKDYEKEFASNYPEMNQKVNCSDHQKFDSVYMALKPAIIECSIYHITPELQSACNEKNVKLMANCLNDKWIGYEMAIKKGVDLVNIDHPDYFSQMLRHKEHKFASQRLIAHRGGIVEGLYDEFDPCSIQAAIDSGYWMLEIDVRPTADNKLIVHHDATLQRIYGDLRRPEELSLSELKALKAKNGGYAPLTFDEVADMCEGKIRIMVDVKPYVPEKWFIQEIENTLLKYNLAHSAYYIRNDIEDMCKYGRFGVRMADISMLMEKVANREDINSRYYLFDHGNRINAEVANWCQQHNIDVCASVNVGHYKREWDVTGAKRDVEHLLRCGVTAFQIDSQYDEYFETYY